MNSISPNLNIMIKASQKASKALIRDFGEIEKLQVSIKGPSNFVSNADTKAEKIIIEELMKAKKNYSIISEEDGSKINSDSENVWIIDPIDGTSNFLHGIPHFAISIALKSNNEIISGLIYDPIKDEMFWAEKGIGAYLQKNEKIQRIVVSNVSSLEDARTVDYRRLEKPRELDSYVDSLRLAIVATEGTNTLKIGKVAQGFADVVINTNKDVSKWDFCAPQILLEEAGGKVTDIDGAPINYLAPGVGLNKSFVATNGVLHDEVIAFLQNRQR